MAGELYLAMRAFRTSSPVRACAIRLGLAGAVFGGSVGFLMTLPTPGQLQALRAHQPAHAVGAPDDGAGLPVTRWSTTGGDLRAPHFLGLHALQALPLGAWLLERRRRRATAAGSRDGSARPVIALGVAWLGLTAVALTQALRAQPLTAPDPLTLVAAALVLLAALGIAVSGRLTPRLLPTTR